MLYFYKVLHKAKAQSSSLMGKTASTSSKWQLFLIFKERSVFNGLLFLKSSETPTKILKNNILTFLVFSPFLKLLQIAFQDNLEQFSQRDLCLIFYRSQRESFQLISPGP